MLDALFYKEARFKVIRLHIHPHSDMRTVLKTMDSIRFPNFGVSANNIRYAVLELLNNSLRAHRENGVSKRIRVLFQVNDERFRVSVKDFGGGFDLQDLPYSIQANPEEIDPNSKEFIEYREVNHFLRFGLGLYVVKKTFHTVKITFFDNRGLPVTWEKGKTVGTLVNLELGVKTS